MAHSSETDRVPTWGIVWFVVGAVGALLAGLAALVLWLSTHIGLLGASIVVFLGCSLLAGLSYRLSIRPAMRRMEEKLETISYVADLIERGYDWIGGKESLLLRIIEHLLDRLLPMRP